jgi:hypothetical protein
MNSVPPPSTIEKESALPPKKKDPQIFDMIVIVGLVFNLLIAIFILLYWLDLL